MKYPTAVLCGFLLCQFLSAGCSIQKSVDVQEIIGHTKVHFVPDSRVARFDVNTDLHADTLVLSGQTTLPEAKEALLDSLEARQILFADHISVLPSADLGEQVYGLVNNSVANIRSGPAHSAEMVTQGLLGMPLRILQGHHGWYLVQTPDDYISWVNGGSITRIDKSSYHEWKKSMKLIYTNTYGFSYQSPSAASEHVTDLVAGDILRLKGREGDFYRVTYPDGRTGYVDANETKPFDQWTKELRVTPKALIRTAKTMIGVPYLWGGTSTKGIDCSGFTKTTYFMNGRILPRDASQQVRAGKQVDTKKDWKKLETGDLLFFGHPATDSTAQRVVHVGMWIGDNQFIHSSGRVQISNMDSTANNFDPYNRDRYLEARRYLNNWQGNIIQAADMYDMDEWK